MFALLLLITLGVPPAAAPADEWRPLAGDQRYEVSGHMERGWFIYNPASKRPIAPRPATPARSPEKNYGVNMPSHEAVMSSSDFEVRGTDPALGRSLAEAASRSLESRDASFHAKTATPTLEASAPCPGPGPCPNPRPNVPPAPHVPAAIERDLAVIVFAVMLAGVVAFAVLLLVVASVAWLIRWLWRSYAATAPPVD